MVRCPFFIFVLANKNKIMTKVIFLAGFLLFNVAAMGQTKELLRAENWEFKPGAVEFGGVSMMKILEGNELIRLKTVDFSDGTIEYDYLPGEKVFASMYFRWKDKEESECFYFRMEQAGHPQAMQAIQYAPIIKGVNLWNLMGYYQGNANFQAGVPIHVKLVVSGKQMRIYVNGADRPAMEIPRLEGNNDHGSIVFQGQAVISHLTVRPGQVEGLAAAEGIDPTANDPRYIRHWQMTEPDSIPGPVDFSYNLIPDSAKVWKPIVAERRGIVNLTRLYGLGKGHRIVWLRATIHSEEARECLLRLGFLNEVWVFINGQLLYVDKNFFGEPIAKQAGRLAIENGLLRLPLRVGDNELMIGVGSNNFYGWGIAARVDEMRGIEFR